jgi:hypothetical protein
MVGFLTVSALPLADRAPEVRSVVFADRGHRYECGRQVTDNRVGYVADFMCRHFAGNLGAPLELMAIGLLFPGLDTAAGRINAQYMARNP